MTQHIHYLGDAKRAVPVNLADFVDVTADVISIATISGAATSLNHSPLAPLPESGPESGAYISTPHTHTHLDYFPSSQSLSASDAVTPISGRTGRLSASNSTTTVTTRNKEGSKKRPNAGNGQVDAIYTLGGECEKGNGGGGKDTEKSVSLIKKEEIKGHNASAKTNREGKAGDAMERCGILGRGKGIRKVTEQRTDLAKTERPRGDSSTLINVKDGTCSYSSNGNINRSVVFETPGISVTETTELEG
ncbi:hypothetical protein PoB_003861200 [Plakobranchus ocellatus]|uniref:Uncharacterized protein n=1 Tax=Plakobranchus ocellatus TaxID=259542 RepID=A0AAV4AYX2_9GAST|nr:hypothetical protein PoB_003861200 [Plakobranchus ocellatus]